MSKSVRLGKVAGIAIEVNYSWLIIFALITFTVATSWLPSSAPGQASMVYWAVGALIALLLFASVLLHELAHSLVAKARGLGVTSINLFVFGGVSNIERTPQRAGVELVMALVGPVMSLLLGGGLLLLAVLTSAAVPRIVLSVVEYLALTNLLLGVFNLIPGFPLDGGRILRAIIWKASGSLATATRWAARVGQLVAYLMIIAGIWLFFAGNAFGGIWISFVGWFLLEAARAETMQVEVEAALGQVTVGDVMTPAGAGISSRMPLQQLVDEHILREGRRTFAVIDDERFVGVITLHDVRQVERDLWPFVPVGQAMVPAGRVQVAQPAQPATEALGMMSKLGIGHLPVVDAGRLVGEVSLEGIVRWMEVRRSLGMGEPSPRVPAPPASSGAARMS